MSLRSRADVVVHVQQRQGGAPKRRDAQKLGPEGQEAPGGRGKS